MEYHTCSKMLGIAADSLTGIHMMVTCLFIVNGRSIKTDFSVPLR
jgi:hypothetical protein